MKVSRIRSDNQTGRGTRSEKTAEPLSGMEQRFDPVYRRGISAAGLRTFLAIADLWGLNEDERRLVLGYPPRSTFHHWAKKAREHRELLLDVDTLTRISLVLGIHQALIILYGAEQDGLDWLKGIHRDIVFGGKPPLHLVTSGSMDGLLSVRRFLDAARGGIYMQPNEADHGFVPYDDSDIEFL